LCASCGADKTCTYDTSQKWVIGFRALNLALNLWEMGKEWVQVTLVQCFPGIMKGKLRKSALEWHKRFKKNSHMEITNEDNALRFLRYQGYCSCLIHVARQYNQPYFLCGGGGYWRQFLAKKIDYWNVTPTLFPWFGSKRLLTVSRNKVCLKMTKISWYWRRPDM
jgi:hypothetical protein